MSHTQLKLFEEELKHTTNRPMSMDARGLRNAETLTLPLGLRHPHAPAPSARPQDNHVKLRHRSYDAMVAELKGKYQIAIRKWRKHMSGVAYELKYRDGRIKRLITAPRPRSPVSASIFLHEVGHHAVGFRRYKPRCLEEYYVWQWAFREMTARNIPVDDRVLKHYRRSMFHYVRMAKRRGIKELPEQLGQFLTWPG
jgi:hypothetical protein